ncbi:hypothetical protein OUZ56_006234 [Daphnia magna]|uniref:Uncharacterized protein n=1 Tax=Daphnia magna TaxID=35525 RepID=A0ABQ9YV25_9CRUS|nr:hypothetical protein OUZ56_006234 [Daphnia magna]
MEVLHQSCAVLSMNFSSALKDVPIEQGIALSPWTNITVLYHQESFKLNSTLQTTDEELFSSAMTYGVDHLNAK